MTGSRYAKFGVAALSAILTLLLVLLEQHVDLVPRELQPWLLFAAHALVALGVRQVPNTTTSPAVAARESVTLVGPAAAGAERIVP